MAALRFTSSLPRRARAGKRAPHQPAALVRTCLAARPPPAGSRDRQITAPATDRGRRWEEMSISGINARQIDVFNKEYKASPQSFTLGLEAKTIWEGRGLGNLGKVGPWKLGK